MCQLRMEPGQSNFKLSLQKVVSTIKHTSTLEFGRLASQVQVSKLHVSLILQDQKNLAAITAENGSQLLALVFRKEEKSSCAMTRRYASHYISGKQQTVYHLTLLKLQLDHGILCFRFVHALAAPAPMVLQ